MDNLLGLTVLAIMRIGFVNAKCGNPDMFGFQNSKGNLIYVSKEVDCIEISVYKVSTRCSHLNLYLEDEKKIQHIVNVIIAKLKISESEIVKTK